MADRTKNRGDGENSGNGNRGNRDNNGHEENNGPRNNGEDQRSLREINNSTVNFDPHGDDPYGHIETMMMVCSTMKPQGADVEEVLRRTFHFTMEGKAKEWLRTLPQHYTTLTWEQLKTAFLEKFFPASRSSKLKKAIFGAQQDEGESFYEYWTRFLTMMARCPNHQISKSNLVQYFYEGLLPLHQRTINAAANGSILDLTPQGAWDLFEKTATNDQQYGTRDKHVCPSRIEEVSAMYQGRTNNQKWDPYSNTYNEGWRDNPRFSWRNNEARGQNHFSQGNVGSGIPSNQFQDTSRMVIPLQDNSLSQPKSDETSQLLKSMSAQLNNMDNRLREDKALNDSQFSSIASILQKMQGDKVNDSAQLTNLCKRFEALEMKNNTLTSHLTQVSNTVSDLQAKNGGGLPSNTVINPKSLNAINLRSGRVVKFSNEDDEEVDEEIECDSLR
ncbi:uncharacterized protein LOC114729069 [Neltuma alba]|uniref:uncharacterized protein LOC114729069 n=1 Tax=Neltuma alba TaxID=207710 RepID=UPI0010A417E8|nr:uncharacterized protein LOC114729069 [Prosopis alba]